MDNPLVSVIMTVYNRELYIKDAIESVISSTYKNWELIIVDDCSKDKSVEIAKQYQTRDSRIKVFTNDFNLGDYPNRNKAASYATGKYLKYLDADDLLYPYGLEIMVETMEHFPEGGLGISKEVKDDKIPYPFQLDPHETYKREFLSNGVLGVGPTGTIIKHSVFKEIGGFSGARHYGDIELWLKIAQSHPIVKIQSGLFFWRQHEGQEIIREYKNPSVIYLRYNFNLNVLSKTNIPLLDSEKQTALKRIKFRYARKIIHIGLVNFSTKNAFLLIRKSKFSLLNLFLGFLPEKIFKRLCI